ncbi:hypothetical protein [Acinetobacter sp. MD2]|uniref:hypothetical protein n=1 Tax=Acinetobacter sp. MD2 TaxID=2600066 RepID=UPI002D1E4C16|nr:hypothetical protein [Acinetobacter sp. MD2]MEB3767034.1 DUF2071 domain-containing protein [Acinetobacter sp. MD2]
MHKHQIKFKHLSVIQRVLLHLLTCKALLKVRRWLMRYVPFMRLKSEVTDVVYLSWLVDADAVIAQYPDFVPFWQKDGKTIFTILTYQHHHFGLAFLGPLRKFFPSPKQSNWRFYLAPMQANKTVIFEQVIVDQLLYVLGGRLASDVMPAQLAAQFEHCIDSNAEYDEISTQIQLDEQYSFSAQVRTVDQKQLPKTWQPFFNDWSTAVKFLVDQDHAWSQWSDDVGRLSQGNIEMPIQFEQISPAKVQQIQSPEILKQWTTQTEPEVFAFIVPNLNFYVQGEQIVLSDTLYKKEA